MKRGRSEKGSDFNIVESSATSTGQRGHRSMARRFTFCLDEGWFVGRMMGTP